MVAYFPVSSVEPGDLCWFDFHGEVLPVEVLFVGKKENVEIVLLTGKNCFFVEKNKLMVRRYR